MGAIVDLEIAAAGHWAAAESESLDTWVLRAAGGFTGRANAALAVRRPISQSVPDLLAATREWYEDRGLRPSVAVPVGTFDGDADYFAELNDVLTNAGWKVRVNQGGLVMTADTETLIAGPDWPAGFRAVVADHPSDDWLAAYLAASAHRMGEAANGEVPPAVLHLLMSAPQQSFLTVYASSGEVAATSRFSIDPDHPEALSGITAVNVVPAYRRRGLAAASLTAAAQWALANGSSRTFLQVAPTNDAAIPLYRRAGFTVHHAYEYVSPQ